MKPRRQPPVDIHFSIIRTGTGRGSGMTSEPGTTTMTTTRVSTLAVAAKTKTMWITVTTTMIEYRRDRFTLLIAPVETLFKVTRQVFVLFSFNILSNHISRTTTGTVVNWSVGTPQGAIILPSEIHQADIPGIHDTGIQTLGHLRRGGLES